MTTVTLQRVLFPLYSVSILLFFFSYLLVACEWVVDLQMPGGIVALTPLLSPHTRKRLILWHGTAEGSLFKLFLFISILHSLTLINLWSIIND